MRISHQEAIFSGIPLSCITYSYPYIYLTYIMKKTNLWIMSTCIPGTWWIQLQRDELLLRRVNSMASTNPIFHLKKTGNWVPCSQFWAHSCPSSVRARWIELGNNLRNWASLYIQSLNKSGERERGGRGEGKRSEKAVQGNASQLLSSL